MGKTSNNNLQASKDDFVATSCGEKVVSRSEGRIEIRNRFIEMRAKGHSIRSIAKKLGLSPQTLLNWQAELEDEIARFKAMELEALYERYHLLKEHRIKILGEQIRSIQEELGKRDLSEVPTDKLLDLQLKYMDEAEKEYVEPRFLSDDDIGILDNKTRSKLDSEDVHSELALVLLKYRRGILSDSQVKQEISILQAALKAEDQMEIQRKLDKLETLLDGRK